MIRRTCRQWRKLRARYFGRFANGGNYFQYVLIFALLKMGVYLRG